MDLDVPVCPYCGTGYLVKDPLMDGVLEDGNDAASIITDILPWLYMAGMWASLASWLGSIEIGKKGRGER